jgi:hypothetical protein
METTDKIFIENNICSINDYIINTLIRTREDLIAKGALKLVPVLEDLIIHTRLAKEKGLKIEGRLKEYFYTIRSLGFSRDRGWQDIEVVGNQVVIRTDSINKKKADYEILEGLNIL